MVTTPTTKRQRATDFPRVFRVLPLIHRRLREDRCAISPTGRRTAVEGHPEQSYRAGPLDAGMSSSRDVVSLKNCRRTPSWLFQFYAPLYQVQDGKPRVIAYGSRSLSVAEGRYSTYRREFLVLKWSVTEKFKQYLYGNKFHVVTDSNPLTYLL